MNHNNPIHNKVNDACECVGLTFFFDTWNRANRKLETEMRERAGNIYPAALMISTSSGAFQFLPSGTHRQEEVVIAIFDRTERDDTERDSEVQQCAINYAGALLEELPTFGLEIIGDAVRYSPFTDRLDENVAGIVLTLTLRDTTPEDCRL